MFKVFFKQIDIYKNSSKRSNDKEILIHYYFFRPLSFFLSIPFIFLKISPNAATTFNLLVLMAACSSIFLLDQNPLLVSSLLYLLFYSMDFVDGNLARYFKMSSILGKNLDGSIDLLGKIYFFCIGVYLISENIVDGILSMLFCILVFYFQYLKLRFQSVLVRPIALDEGSDGRTLKKNALLHRMRWLYYNLSELLPIILPVSFILNFYSVLIIFYLSIYLISSIVEMIRLGFQVHRLDVMNSI